MSIILYILPKRWVGNDTYWVLWFVNVYLDGCVQSMVAYICFVQGGNQFLRSQNTGESVVYAHQSESVRESR